MGSRHSWLAYVLGIAAMLAASGAQADGGQLTFTGRIVESTCPVGPDVRSSPGADFATGKVACGSQANDDRSYDVSRMALTGNEPDRVLRYFNDYVRAGDPTAQPTLVVRVYE
jgi:hypothetical protein